MPALPSLLWLASLLAASAAPPAPPIDEVVVLPSAAEGAPRVTVSLGAPNGGWLIDGVPLPSSDRIRAREGRNFGTLEVVEGVIAAVDAVHARFPKRTHRLIVGDLSRPGGGRLRPHLSHQSGRDADIGYYYASRRSPGYFQAVTPRTLDVARTWTLIDALLATGEVQYLFVDYRLQKALHDYARHKARVPRGRLSRIFSYPRGRKARVGVIRHEPGHGDHMHVRFHATRSVANAVGYIRRHGPEAVEPVPVHHHVRKGNTLGGIAREHHTSVKRLRKWNDLGRRDHLGVGQRLVVGWERPPLPETGPEQGPEEGSL